MNFISKYSIKTFLGLLLAVILFHICIILKIIPYNIAWGGRLTNDAEMYVFETISILINIFLSIILLIIYTSLHDIIAIINRVCR